MDRCQSDQDNGCCRSPLHPIRSRWLSNETVSSFTSHPAYPELRAHLVRQKEDDDSPSEEGPAPPNGEKLLRRDEGRVHAASAHVADIRERLVALGETIQGDVLLPPSVEGTGTEAEAGKANDDDNNSEAYHWQRERTFFLNDSNYPSAILVCETEQDVAEAIRFVGTLDRSKYRLAVAAGCHSHYCMVDEAVVIDLERMSSVDVDETAKTIRIGGGAKIQVANRALKGTGLGFATGTNGDTGVSGLTLAGGVGYLGGIAGYACDTVIEARVVLPTGEAVVATDDNEHADLLRALRGGGGNFGIVTQWTFRLFDVTNAFAGSVVHLAPTVARLKIVLDRYAEVLRDLPDNASATCAMPGGAPVFMSVYTVIGGENDETCRNATSYRDVPFLSGASDLGGWVRLSNDLGRKDYHDEICPMLEPFQQRTHGSVLGAMVYDFGDKIRDALVHFTRVDLPKARNTKPVIIIQSLSGEMRRNDGSRSSLRHRRAVAWIIFEASYEPHATEKQIEAVMDWMKRAKSRIIELGGEDGPHNFKDTDGRRTKFLTEEQREFLKQAKSKYDPNNLFSLNKNIISQQSD